MLLISIAGCGVKGNPAVLKNYSGNGQTAQDLKFVSVCDAALSKQGRGALTLKHHDASFRQNKLTGRNRDCKDCPKVL